MASLESRLSPSLSKHLLASRVAGSRYAFLNLAPAKGTRWALALAGREECAPDYLVNRDDYPFHVLEFVAAGRGFVRLAGGEEQAIGAGSIFASAPKMSTWIRSDPEAPLVKFFFALAGREVEARLTAANLSPGAVRWLTFPAEMLAIAEELIHEGNRHERYAAEICAKLVEILLLKAAGAAAPGAVGEDRARENFRRCRALIDTQARSLASLEEIAHAVRLEPESVCRLFRRFQGTSPYQYLLRRKMALAAEFLVESGGLVKEAAAHVGFDDPYHFARCFKAVHGFAPSSVRGLRRGNMPNV